VWVLIPGIVGTVITNAEVSHVAACLNECRDPRYRYLDVSQRHTGGGQTGTKDRGDGSDAEQRSTSLVVTGAHKYLLLG
jgi:hypothetical protein